MPKQQQSKKRRGRDRRLSVRSNRRHEPDLRKIAGTVIALAMAQAEKEAQAQCAQSADEGKSADE